MKVPESGGTPAPLVNDQGAAYLAVDSGTVYWADGAGQIAAGAEVGARP